MKYVSPLALVAGLAFFTVGTPSEANAIALAACPAGFTTDGTAKVYYGAAPPQTSASDSCQYLTPPANHNDSDDGAGGKLNVNDIDGGGSGPGFFGITGWDLIGGGDINASSGSWAIPGTVDFTHYAYMLMFKDGNGTDLTGFLLNEEASSGSWLTPFTDPPFDLPGASTSHDVSHLNYYRYLDCPLTSPSCGGPGPGPVPEPASLLLLGTGLLGLAAARRRRRV